MHRKKALVDQLSSLRKGRGELRLVKPQAPCCERPGSCSPCCRQAVGSSSGLRGEQQEVFEFETQLRRKDELKKEHN